MNKSALFFIALAVIALTALLLIPLLKDESVPTSTGDSKGYRPLAETEPSHERAITLIPESSPLVSAPKPDPHEALLDTLYESPVNADRIEAARQIAARNDERGMSDLATFISAAEEHGDPSLMTLAEEVAEVLGQMHGPEVEALATELAYAPSSLVAEAAVNAAVRSKANQVSENVFPAQGLTPTDQQALDDYVQIIRNEEEQP
jgi:hypothetical protein